MQNKDILNVSARLFVITALAALCLAFVNRVTAPVIEKNQKLAMENTQREVLTEAESFKTVDFSSDSLNEAKENGTYIKSFYKGLKGEETVGYTVTAVSQRGYGGDIEVTVGYDKDLKITKVKITETSETAGLGLKASEPEFIDQFEGRSDALTVKKNSAPTTEGEDIAAISGATITSNAVTNAVNAATELVNQKSASADEKQDSAEAIKNEIIKETERQIKEGK